MEMTYKYIKVLNWGYGGFSPMAISSDYKASLEQVKYRLSLLDGLNYDTLLDEALGKGKEYLCKYQKTDTTFEYGLHFMRDAHILLADIPTMFKGFADVADRFRADGLWTDEQWREYRGAIYELERAFELRLKQFATAYDYPLSDDPNTPEPQQEQTNKTRGRGRPRETLKDKMLDDTDGKKLQTIHTKICGKKGKDAALIILACIKKGWITRPTYTQVKNEFGDIGSKTGYNRYLNEQAFTKEELEGVINSLD